MSLLFNSACHSVMFELLFTAIVSLHHHVPNVCIATFHKIRRIFSIHISWTTDAVKTGFLTGSVTHWLFQVCTRRFTLVSPQDAVICAKYCCKDDLLGTKMWSCLATSSKASLVTHYLWNEEQNFFIVLQLFIWNWATILIRCNLHVYICRCLLLTLFALLLTLASLKSHTRLMEYMHLHLPFLLHFNFYVNTNENK